MSEFFRDLKAGIISIFKGKADDNNLFKLDGRPTLKRAIPFGIQHILAMFVANITPLIIVFASIGILGTPLATQSMLGALFMAGIGTIIQLLIGARLPIVIGTSFTFVGILITIGLSAGGGEVGYYTIMGSIFVGGLIATVCCFFVKWWGKLIKPIVPCVVVFAIGLSLVQSGANQFLGGSNVLNNFIEGNQMSVPYYVYIIVAVVTLVSTILFQVFAKGVWKNLNIIFGIVVGYIVAVCIPGMIDFSSLNISSVTDVIAYPHFIDFTKLVFQPVPILLTTVCFLMAVVEGIGDTNALCAAGLDREPTTREITGVLVSDGFNSFICSFFGALPLTTFSQNVGIVAQTKVTNRFTIFIGACFLVLISLFPIVANFIYTIPDCVLGGTMVILFGSIAVVGIKMCANLGFSDKNMLILAISICLGFGVTLNGDFFTFLNSVGLNYVSDLLSNNVLNMFIIAMLLSWVLPDDMSFKGKKNKPCMIHEMKLYDDSFKVVQKGTKTIEMRLNDEKRSGIKVNDIIEFTNTKTNEKMKAKVIGLYKYESFDALYQNFSKISLGYGDNEIANPEDMLQYYSKDMIDKYGVLGIEIAVIS